MTNIAGAIGLEQLKKLPGMNANRKKAADYYTANIKNELVVTPQKADGHVYHQYTVKIKSGLRDKFVDFLTENGIGHGVFYPLTTPEQKCYSNLNLKTDYPVADEVKSQVVSIPVHPGLTDDEIRKITDVINSFKGE
jgi:perosamine synthetase